MNRHRELEYKFAADHVPMRLFEAIMEGSLPDVKEPNKAFDDVYYMRGANFVRHRLYQNGELTSKARTSEDSLADRVEINVRFSADTTQEDVEAFLLATGWERMFNIRKLHATVYHFRFHHCDIETSIYTCGRVDKWGISNVRQFIEVELKNNKDLKDDEVYRVLDGWKVWFQQEFSLAEPLNQSLLEIYSTLTSPSTATTHYKI